MSETYYRVTLTIATPIFICGSALRERIGSLSEEIRTPCFYRVGFVGMLERYGLPETFASVIWFLSTA